MTVCKQCGDEKSHYYFKCGGCGQDVCWMCATHASHDCVRLKRQDEYDIPGVYK